MYNFNNLSDFEFEILCKDIMEKELGISLHIFGKGRDGGIDLTDDCINKNIVIQVKHYINSTFSNLKSSLQSEVNKVNIMKPKQYYICCAKSLSPSNTVEIYNMFSKYMDSDRNIISLNDINEFLENPQNISIVRKNYKLWLQATNKAKEKYSEFNMFVEDKKIKLHIIDMNKVSIADKGLILYNHLFYKNVPLEYYNNILTNKKYVNIVKHNNYTPRIIEFVTREVNYKRIDASDYAKFILGVLDFPNGIWEEEFNRRLQKEDRIFMTTLYSLTDTTISLNILRRAYNYRLYNSKCVDTTINIFENVLSRMSNSLVIIYDKNGEKEVGVINPSVNDYLKGYIEENELEIKSIVENITEYCQVKRFLMDKGEENQIVEMMKNGEMLEINYLNKVEEVYVIISYICKYEILREDYEDIIGLFLNDLSYGNFEGMMNRNQIVSSLLKEPFFSYYHIEDYFQYENCECFFEDMSLDEINEFFFQIDKDNVMSFSFK